MLPRLHNTRPTGGSAFTLIELLIVIAIIAVLVAVSMAVGHRVLGAGKARTTEDLIRVLDSSVVAFEQETGGLPPAKFAYMPQAANASVVYEYAIIDGRRVVGYSDASTTTFDRDEAPPEQSVARYTAMCKLVPAASTVISGINAKYTRTVNITGAGAAPTQPATGIEVLDAWGRPIRMVHPAFDGGSGVYFTTAMQPARTPPYDQAGDGIEERRGQGTSVTRTFYRRSFRPFNPATATNGWVGDADEGLCPNRRPYFYSAGPDGDPGKREDNVYTTRPTFTQETAQYK